VQGTVLDVVENALGCDIRDVELEDLSRAQIGELAIRVSDFYDSVPPRFDDDVALRFTPGVARPLGGSAPIESRSALALLEHPSEYLLPTLLYAEQVALVCPVDPICAELAFRFRRWPRDNSQTDPERRYQWALLTVGLKRAIAGCVELAPLIRLGAISLMPMPTEPTLYTAALGESSVRGTIATDWVPYCAMALEASKSPDYDRDRDLLGDLGAPVDDPERYRMIVRGVTQGFNMSLARAAWWQCHYLPADPVESAMLKRCLGSLGRSLNATASLDVQVINALTESDLPLFHNLSPRLLVDIRNEPGFGEWRVALRNAVRLITSSWAEPDVFAKEAHDVFSDTLSPIGAEIRRTTALSNVLSSNAKQQVLEFGVASAAIAGVSLVAGSPISVPALEGAAIASGLRLAYSAVFGVSQSGARGVIARLVTTKRTRYRSAVRR
jgi:hypothetical protein